MELNKMIQDLKREVDTIKTPQNEAMLEIETLGKKSGTIDASISNKIQEMEERISGGGQQSHPTPARAHTGFPTGS
jgi:predicted  nucleic acid-binding Zn-ribbon protein